MYQIEKKIKNDQYYTAEPLSKDALGAGHSPFQFIRRLYSGLEVQNHYKRLILWWESPLL